MTPVKMHTLLLYRCMYIMIQMSQQNSLQLEKCVHVCGFLSYYLTIINVCQYVLIHYVIALVRLWLSDHTAELLVTVILRLFYKAQLATPTPPTWSCSTALMGVTTLVKIVDTPVKMHAVKHTYLLYRCISSSLSSLLWWLLSSWSSCWWWLWSSVPTSEKSLRERRGACTSSLSFRMMEIYNYSK